MTGRKDFLTNLNNTYPYLVGLPNGNKAIARQEGTVSLNPHLKLLSVFYILDLKYNLISLAQLA